MIFVSFVGMQVMAVLNPWLAACNLGLVPKRLLLLPTTVSSEVAKRIRDFVTAQHPGIEVEISVVSAQLRPVAESSTHPPGPDGEVGRRGHESAPDEGPGCIEALRKGAEGHAAVIFNLAGGMNYQIAACIPYLPTRGLTLAYPESAGIHFLTLTAGAAWRRVLAPLPTPVDLFRLQKIPFKVECPPPPDQLCLAQLRLPDTIIRNLVLGRVTFDLAWNSGNELRLVKILDGKLLHLLDRSRAVIALATARSATHELYHRAIIVMTNRATIEQRLQTETNGKVEVIRYDSRAMLRDKLRLLLPSHGAGHRASATVATRPAPLPAPARPVARMARRPGDGTTLYTSLGPDPLPTLVAIHSHRCSQVRILFTPGVSQIERLIAAWDRNPDLLPMPVVEWIPTSVDGFDILDRAMTVKERVVANVTPGTKGQGAFLALFARCVSGETWSIDNQAGTLTRLDRDAPVLPLVGPGIIDLLKLRGETLLDEGTGGRSLMTRSTDHELLLGFLRSLFANGLEPSQLALQPPPSISTRDGFVLKSEGRRQVRLEAPGGDTCRIDMSGGLWFEELIGYCCLVAGADEVRVRVRTRWGSEIEQYLNEAHDTPSFKTDVDVIARAGSRYFVISCKLGKNLGGAAKEIRAVAAQFGRFAVPMLATIAMTGEPSCELGMWRFGIKTIIDPDSLRSVFARATRQRSDSGAVRGECRL